MAPVYFALKSRQTFSVSVCSSGQHTTLLQTALMDFGIRPQHELELMGRGQNLASLTSRAIEGLDTILDRTGPDMVLVHGDTTTALAASICSFYRKIPVGHVEAGLRTGSLSSPFPEEFNRQAISRIATLNFAPTLQSMENLLNEGVSRESIFLTGNTIVDSIKGMLVEFTSAENSKLIEGINQLVGFEVSSQRFVLVTMHRRENLGSGLRGIFEAVAELAVEFPTVNFVLPLHPNPQVQSTASDSLPDLDNLVKIDPVCYRDFIYLLGNCDFVLTDSGGIQEEAVTLGKNVLIARTNTERPEGLATGLMHIVGTEKSEIVSACRSRLLVSKTTNSLEIVSHAYGDGDASKLIEASISAHFGRAYVGDPVKDQT